MKKNEIMKIANKMGRLKKIIERERGSSEPERAMPRALSVIKFKSTILCFIIFPTITL